VLVALGIQHAMGLLHTVICDLSGFTVFYHISSTAQFLEEEEEREKESETLLQIERVF
jgi:hypothetical protein